ncbi:g1764 [Coccomyxa elongata]
MDASDNDDFSNDVQSDDDLGYYTESEEGKQDQGVSEAIWYVIDANEISAVQEKALQDVMGIMGCSRSIARTLLMHFRWSTETLFGVLAERDKDELYKLASVTSRSTEIPSCSGSQAEVACGCCFCDVPREETSDMGCGHVFCNDCWSQHCKVQIKDGRSRKLPCMGVKCGAACDEETVRQLISDDQEILARFDRSLLESYVEDNAMVRWCPSVPHCGRAIRVEGEVHCEPECSCGLRFCFACGEEAHSPCTCEMWKQWKEKCHDDSETKNWMTANTKPCPKCGKPVEKNGGCNLVMCTCRQAFCWLCGAATGTSHTWTEISGHSCGRYKDEADRRIDEAQRNVKRYMHYYTRWEAHMKSSKAEAETRTSTQEKIAALEDNTSLLKDYSWLSQAQEQLFHARRVLGYSYVYAFYMFGNAMFREEITPDQNAINQNLFEDQQQQLEAEVERLSGLVEMGPERIGKVEDQLRLQVINSTININKRLVNLYELIENDLLGSLQFSVGYIAPYGGKSTLRPDRATPTLTTPALPASKAQDEDLVDLTGLPSSEPALGRFQGREGLRSGDAAKRPRRSGSLD